MQNQPRMDSLDTPMAYQAGLVLLGAGSVLVLSSFSALGFTGTFLGKIRPHSGSREGAGPLGLVQLCSCQARQGVGLLSWIRSQAGV